MKKISKIILLNFLFSWVVLTNYAHGQSSRSGDGNFLKSISGPLMDRITEGTPILMKAIGLLLIFWVIAMIAGSAVRKLLSLTSLDEKLVKDLGLGKFLTTSSGKQRKVENIAGSFVKWIILAFGFVAFLQTLNLQMVAGPLQNVLDKILLVIPQVLKGLTLLALYWVAATLFKILITKGLVAVGFDDKANKYIPSRPQEEEKTLPPSALLGRLVFYVILLFGIPPFLNALGQESLVTPLQGMLSKSLGYLPNLFAAGIIFLVGYVIATILREIVSNFLSAAGADHLAKRIGSEKLLDKKSVSQVVGTIVYFFVLVPVIVSAVDALKIRAISDPVKATLAKVLAAVPALLVATIIVGLGFVIAKVIRGLVESLLKGVGFDGLPEKIGLNFLKPTREGMTLSSLAGTFTMAIILLLTCQEALAQLGLQQLSSLVNTFVLYLPNLIVGLVIFFAALSIASYFGSLVAKATSGSGHSGILERVTKIVIIFFGSSIAMTHLGVGSEIVFVAVASILGGCALALGIAFGLGGRDRAKEIIENGNLDKAFKKAS